MGTNYYLRKPLQNLCECCGRHDPVEEVHLGKSSGGWYFSLHVYPDGGDGVVAFSDWDGMVTWLRQELASGGIICNEYGEEKGFEQFEDVVTKRSWQKDWDTDWWAPRPFGTKPDGTPFMLPGYTSEDHFHRSSHSKRGPNGLLRHQVDGRHCIANGSGAWDCIVGEFS